MPSTKHSAWPILVQKYLSDKQMKGKASVDRFNPNLKPHQEEARGYGEKHSVLHLLLGTQLPSGWLWGL